MEIVRQGKVFMTISHREVVKSKGRIGPEPHAFQREAKD